MKPDFRTEELPDLRERWRSCDSISIGVVNNMPDAALQDTEQQFSSLFTAASKDIQVQLRFYTLPEITRGPEARQHISESYSSFSGLRNDGLDGLVITGTEPREQDLRRETYWPTLAGLLDWAEGETLSTFLSCLASHASVLHSDGIERHRLEVKRFGVFAEERISENDLTLDIPASVRMPHSRWNDVREDDLKSRGYTVITRSHDGGVGLFAKQKNDSLFVYSQGHLEYSTHTLLKECRRDVKRFLAGQQEKLPPMPVGYLDPPSAALLTTFRQQLTLAQGEIHTPAFPFDAIASKVRNGWHATGILLFRNWLRWMQQKKGEAARPGLRTSHPRHFQRNSGLDAVTIKTQAKGGSR